MISEQELRRLVQTALPGAEVTAHDLTGGRDHYRLVVVAAAFDGLGLLGRHRLVNDALRAAFAGPLHAATLETLTPEEASRR